MDWIAYRLAQLTGRERLLLLMLVAVILPVAVGFMVIAPVLQARTDAALAAQEADALRDWVAARVTDLPPEGLSSAAPTTGTDSAPIGLSGLERSLVDAGLRDRVAQLANMAGGGVDLQFDAVAFDALIGWLADTTPGWGYQIAAFRIERADPGRAEAGFTLEPAE